MGWNECLGIPKKKHIHIIYIHTIMFPLYAGMQQKIQVSSVQMSIFKGVQLFTVSFYSSPDCYICKGIEVNNVIDNQYQDMPIIWAYDNHTNHMICFHKEDTVWMT